MMIIARYMLFALLTLVVSAVWFVSPLYDGYWKNLVHTIGSAYMALAIYYPVMYLLRGEKGDIDKFIFMAAMLGSLFGLARLVALFGTAAMLGVIGVAYVASFGLSVGLERFWQGRAG
ncbi:MAG: hypothetical protein FWC16_04535 [Defluviitaleaceae bacterium]|nr:hypothetical protein [Defluviitaleaceae bacterium]MCL2274175.1 hypothetical protein [Defluviitaleaceae bacterium]